MHYSASSYSKVVDYLQLNCTSNREVFGAIFCDTQRKIITCQQMFIGTLDAVSMYPRDIAKHALINDAKHVILYHNHPSGCSEPCNADIEVTYKIQQALALFDISIADHIIIADCDALSFAKLSLL